MKVLLSQNARVCGYRDVWRLHLKARCFSTKAVAMTMVTLDLKEAISTLVDVTPIRPDIHPIVAISLTL